MRACVRVCVNNQLKIIYTAFCFLYKAAAINIVDMHDLSNELHGKFLPKSSR